MAVPVHELDDGVFKTGMRVPETGHYVDQYGTVSTHLEHGTFPPCVDNGECAYRRLVEDQ